jgi:hypothetical protein
MRHATATVALVTAERDVYVANAFCRVERASFDWLGDAPRSSQPRCWCGSVTIHFGECQTWPSSRQRHPASSSIAISGGIG